MTHRERVTSELRRTGPLCDDCLSDRSEINPRQAVNQVARTLHREGLVARNQAMCPACRRLKLVNSLGSAATSHESPSQTASFQTSGSSSPKRSWHWEGNVQGRIVGHLVNHWHAIRAVADTASRAPGKDVETETPDGKTMWVSVKGFPENKRSQNTQARHWFSHALFDMILYRDEDPEAELAIGLPTGFPTYRNLSQRIAWFKRAVPFRIFWVHEDGHVEVE